MQKNIMAKIGMITGFLIILSILLLCISGVVSERERFKEKVSTDISKTWGKRQTIDLPKLIYEHSDKTLIKTAAKGRKISVETKDGDTITKYIYADSIDTNADVKGELKQKSIYKLYKTQNNEYCSAVKIMQVISSIPLIFTAINQHNLKGDIKNFGNVLMLSFIYLPAASIYYFPLQSFSLFGLFPQ